MGFPSPAEHFASSTIDFNQVLIQHPESTYVFRVEGNSMKEAGIVSGDRVIVDRSLAIEPGKTVVAMMNGEFLIRKLIRIQNKLFLSNGVDPGFEIKKNLESAIEFFGVVTMVLHVPS